MSASGRVSLSNLVLLAAVASAIYFGVLLSPVLVDHFAVQDEIAKALNRSHQLDDGEMKRAVARGLERVGTHWRLNAYGEIEEATGLGVPPEAVLVDRNTVLRTIRVGVPYQRQIRLKPTFKFITLRFNPERELPITR